jgi:aspartate 1-decarboxylase
MDREIKKPITSDKTLNALGIENFENFKRFNTFAITGMRTPGTIYIVVI